MRPNPAGCYAVRAPMGQLTEPCCARSTRQRLRILRSVRRIADYLLLVALDFGELGVDDLLVLLAAALQPPPCPPAPPCPPPPARHRPAPPALAGTSSRPASARPCRAPRPCFERFLRRVLLLQQLLGAPSPRPRSSPFRRRRPCRRIRRATSSRCARARRAGCAPAPFPSACGRPRRAPRRPSPSSGSRPRTGPSSP